MPDRYQRVKIGFVGYCAHKIRVEVPQGSVSGPIIFKVSIVDLFFFNLDSEICNFSDDSNIFACGNDLYEG